MAGLASLAGLDISLRPGTSQLALFALFQIDAIFFDAGVPC